MFLPMASSRSRRSETEIIEFMGYNDTPQASKEEILYMHNLSSDSFPLLATRNPRKKIRKLEKPISLFSTKELCWIDGTKFYYNGVHKLDVTESEKSIIDFNGNIVIFPDKKYYDYVEDKTGAFESPDIDYATVHNNRVFGIEGNNIYSSKLGDFKKWDEFQGLNTDSFATDVAGQGLFTGITTFMNHVVMFKPDMIHEMYGDKPSNFSTQDASKIGTVSNKSIVEVNSSLFYMHDTGIYTYNGGIPRPISLNISKKYISGVAGTDKRKYYISLFDGTSHDLFVFDTYLNIWHREDDLSIIDFTTFDGKLYGLSSDGWIIEFNEGEELFDWVAETQIFHDKDFNKIGTSKILMMLDLDVGSYVTAYVRINNGEYKSVRSFSANTLRTIEIPITISRANLFQIKIVGKGSAKIYAMKRKFYIGSDSRG